MSKRPAAASPALVAIETARLAADQTLDAAEAVLSGQAIAFYAGPGSSQQAIVIAVAKAGPSGHWR